jgi:hypothetical protein
MLGTLVPPPHLRQAHLARQMSDAFAPSHELFLSRFHLGTRPQSQSSASGWLATALNPVHMHAR